MTQNSNTGNEKLYTLAGTSLVDGVPTYRFACGSAKAREYVLKRAGHTDIQFRPTPKPMTLAQCVQWLQACGVQAVLTHGQRRGPNGKPIDAALLKTPEELAAEALAAKKAAFVAKMAAAKLAKKQAQAAA